MEATDYIVWPEANETTTEEWARICAFVDNEEDALLIAAAPDLLEACRAFTAWDDDPHANEADAATLRRTVVTAILKATGGQP